MKQQNEEKKQKNRRKTLNSLCSTSGCLLSVVCCIALIHVELRIQKHHRLISHTVTFCDQMETEILQKVQQNYGRWQVMKGSHSEGHWQEIRSEFVLCLEIFFSDENVKYNKKYNITILVIVVLILLQPFRNYGL